MPSALAVLAAAVPCALADLPLHCLMQDVAGDWQFHVGPALPAAAGTRASIPQCGHHIPNTVTSMLALDHGVEVPSGSEVFPVYLTETIEHEPHRHLKAMISGHQAGEWTMTFDEGFEVRDPSNNRTFFAHFHFEKLPTATSTPSNGDRWDSIGEYTGRKEDQIIYAPEGDLYSCHCDLTSVGWWHRSGPDNSVESGCFWASKPHGKVPDGSLASMTSIVRLQKSKDILARKKHTTVLASEQSAYGLHDIRELPGGNQKMVLRVAPVPKRESLAASSSSLRGHVAAGNDTRGSRSTNNAPVGAQAGQEAPVALPKEWDWRKELELMSPHGTDDLSKQFDQGMCGSCYAFSAALVLQMRFRIALRREHGILYPLELSWRSGTRCSPYTEGCNGGFSFMVFKHAAEIGLPPASCDRAEAPQDLDKTCDWGCYTGDQDLFYAKGYGQVGGFSHGADEESIMREIYMRGPAIVSFSTGAAPEFIWKNGHSARNDTDVMTVFFNDRMKEEKFSTNADVRPWYYTTHAILAVGWGEEVLDYDHKPVVPYWIVRNSWGEDWGTDGYAKMRRGHNDAAMESSSPWVEPDLSRLPAGFLHRASLHHAAEALSRADRQVEAAENAGDQAADSLARAKDAAKGVVPSPPDAAPEAHASPEASSPASPKRRKGTAAYCKMRPDSPDCYLF